MKIGQKLRSIRVERKLKQENMADLLGTSQSNYNKIERDIYNVNIEKILEYAGKLNVKPEELLNNEISFVNHGNAYEKSFSNHFNNTNTTELKSIYDELLKTKSQLLEASQKIISYQEELLKAKK